MTVHLRAEVASYLANQLRVKNATEKTRNEIERLEGAASALTRVGLVSALAGVPGALAPAGVAIAGMSSLTLSAGASFGVLALATHGLGDAFKAVGEGDADKLGEALQGLSEDARVFVAEYQRVKPFLDQFGDDSQDQFFSQLRGDLEKLTTAYIPTMRSQLPQLASALGSVGSDLADMAAAPGTVAAINRQIELATDLTQDWSRLLRAGTGILLDLADVGEDFARDFTGGLADGAEGFRRWLDSVRATGEVNQLLDNGTRIIQKLGQIAAQTGDLMFDFMANPALTDATVALLDLLGMTLDIVHGLVNAFGSLPGPLQSAAATLLAVGGAAFLLVGRIAAMKAAMAGAITKLEATGPAGERAARGLEKAGRHAGKAAGAFVALQVAGALLGSLGDQSADVERLNSSLETLGKTGEQVGEVDRVFGNRGGLLSFLSDDGPREGLVRDLNLVSDGFADIGRSGEAMLPVIGPIQEKLFGQSWTRATENVRSLDQALTEMVRRGELNTARAAFTRLLQQSGKSLEEIEALLPGYTAAIKAAEVKTDDLATSQAKAASKTKLMAGTMGDAVRSGKSLTQVFDELNGEALDWAEAQDDLEQAIDDSLTKVVKHRDGLKSTEQVGRDNRKLLRDIAEATKAATQARYTDTNSLAEANKVYAEGRKAFIDAALAAGATRDAAEELADQWLLMPALVETAIKTPGLDVAIRKLRELKRLVGSTVGAVNFGDPYSHGRRWGGITEHAQTGLLRDAAIYSPRTPARFAFAEPATRGEAFIPKSGDYGRSMSILSHAASWYGAHVVPQGATATTAAAASVATVSPQALASAVRTALQGMTVQLDGHAVGILSGRRAELLRRGN